MKPLCRSSSTARAAGVPERRRTSRRRAGGAPSERVLRSAALFGLTVPAPSAGARGPRAGEVPSSHAWAPRLAARVDRLLLPGQIALVVGPSGAGKSLLMRALAARLGGRGIVAGPRLLSSMDALPLADLDRGPLDVWLGHLARAGLAEARLLSSPARVLSEGQRWRVLLACCLSRAARGAGHDRGGDQGGARATDPARARRSGSGNTGPGGPTILADEFASVLDRLTALGLSRAVRRLIRPSSGLRLVAATAHDDVLEPLCPDVVVHIPLDASPEVLMA
ncbi:MAG: hypothetical protein AB7K52_07995 [Phycisphaerales bacterium]